MSPVLIALLAGLLVGTIAGIWIGGNWITWGEFGRELRGGTPLPRHSLQGGRHWMPPRYRVDP
jgi:hypothetical protein